MVDIVIFGATQRCGSTLLQRIFNQNPKTMIWGENGRILTMLAAAEEMAASFAKASPMPDEEYIRGGRPDDKFIANLNPPPPVVGEAFVGAARTLLATMYQRRDFQRIGFKELSHTEADLALLRRSYPDCALVFLARDPYETWESLKLFAPEKPLGAFLEEWLACVPLYAAQRNFFWYHDIVGNRDEQQRLCDLAGISLDRLQDSLGRKVGSSHGDGGPQDAGLAEEFATITAAIAPLRHQHPHLADAIDRFIGRSRTGAPELSAPPTPSGKRGKNDITYDLFGIDPAAYYSEKFARARVDFSVYPEEARMHMPFLRFEYLGAEIRRHFGNAAGLRVLDVGCGAGRFGGYLRQEFPDIHLIGVDLSPNCEEDVRFHGYRDFLVASPEFTLPLADGSVDAVFSMDFFGHVEFRSKDAIIGETHRVLKPGGIAIHGIETGMIDYLNANPADPDDPVRKYVWIDGHIGVETVPETLDRFRDRFTVDKCLPWVFPFIDGAAALSTNLFGDRYGRILGRFDEPTATCVMNATLRGVYDYIIGLYTARTGAAVFEDVFISDGTNAMKLPHGAFTLMTLKKE